MQAERSGASEEGLLVPSGAFAALRAAFMQEGIEGLIETHRAAKQRPIYRIVCGLLELLVPVTELMEIARDLEQRIGEVGTPQACTDVLSRLPNGWRVEFPERGKDKILEGPIVTYGTHGSILTPLLVAAGLGREDGKVIGISWLAQLGPNIARCTFPIATSSPIRLVAAARSGLVARVAGWLTSKFEAPETRARAKALNRDALTRAVAHVRRGGAVLIAPDPRPPRRKWRPGIGVLAMRLADDPPEADCYLVPMRIWEASITGIFRFLSRHRVLRAIGQWQYRHPARIVFGEPIHLASLVERVGSDPARITEYLERHYRRIGF